ncbi:hypothetical protein CVT30_46805 (plasmid) [Streptomyces sp. AMCC400023]|nr:hypothetical protein CVT30_46805 [Streptomyces sp. AMCC400023]
MRGHLSLVMPIWLVSSSSSSAVVPSQIRAPSSGRIGIRFMRTRSWVATWLDSTTSSASSVRCWR